MTRRLLFVDDLPLLVDPPARATAMQLVLVASKPPPPDDMARFLVWWSGIGRWIWVAGAVGAPVADVATAAAVCRLILYLTASVRVDVDAAARERLAVDELRDAGAVDPGVAGGHQLALDELLSGQPAPSEARPAADFAGWRSPTEIGHRLGVSAQRVGRTISALELRAGPESRAVVTRTGSGRSVAAYVYSPAAEDRIRRRLEDDGHL